MMPFIEPQPRGLSDAERLRTLDRPAVGAAPVPSLPPEPEPSPDAFALELRLYWGEYLFDLRHYAGAQCITIGEAKGTDVFLSSEDLPAEAFPLVRSEPSGVWLSFTGAMHGEIEMGGRVFTLDATRELGARRHPHLVNTFEIPLHLDARVVLHWAGMTFALRFVAPPRRGNILRTGGWDLPYANTLMIAAAAQLSLVGMLLLQPAQVAELNPLDDTPKVVVHLRAILGEEMFPVKPPPPKEQVTPAQTNTRRPRERGEPQAPVRLSGSPSGGVRGGASLDRLREMLASGPTLIAGESGLHAELAALIRSGPVTAAPSGLHVRGEVRNGSSPGVEGLRRIGPTSLEPPARRGAHDWRAKLGAKDARRPELSPAVELDTPRVDQALTRPEIAAVINKNREQMRYCYERVLQREPDLAGRVELRWSVQADGRPTDVRVAATTLGNAEVERCLVERVLRWRFPPPRGGGMVDVRYPLILTSD